MTVDLLPNREIYEDIYPSDSESEDDDEESEEEKDDELLKEINDKLKHVNVELTDQRERIASAANQLQILQNLGSSVTENRPPLGKLK